MTAGRSAGRSAGRRDDGADRRGVFSHDPVPAAAAALQLEIGHQDQRAAERVDVAAADLADEAVGGLGRHAQALLELRGRPAGHQPLGDRQRVAQLADELVEQAGDPLALGPQLEQTALREANDIATRLNAGQSPAQVRKGLRMPTKAAERLIDDVSRRDKEGLRAALAALADLERDSRGGGALSEDTAAVLAVTEAASA